MAAPAVAQAPSPAGASTRERMPPLLSEAGLRWAEHPSHNWIRDRFPKRALRSGYLRGRAELACTPLADGQVSCRVLHESPAGMEFGEAALHVMSRVKVRSVDGSSPAGKTFGLDMRFGNWPPDKGMRHAGLAKMGMTWEVHPYAHPELRRVLKPGEFGQATLSCVSLAEGRLACEVAEAPAGQERFAAAAVQAMNEDGKLKAMDGQPLEGRRFRYPFTLGESR
jgi:hypothetical protein